MRAIVIGGAGFLGGHVIAELSRRGIAPVCADRPGADTEHARSLGAACVDADIRERPTLESHIEPGDLVFHVAALLGVAKATRERYRELNVEGATNAYAAAVSKRAAAFVFPSSLAAQGPVGSVGRPMTEDTPPRPDSLYGWSKLEAERGIAALDDGSVPAIVFRPPPIYGPRFTAKSAAATLFRNMAKPTAFIVGAARNSLPLCFVGNLAHAMVDFALRARPGVSTYLVADGPPLPLGDMLATIGKAFGTNRRLLHVPTAPVLGAARLLEAACKPFGKTPRLSTDVVRGMTESVYHYDLARINDAGWKSPWSFEEGVAVTASWMRETGLA
ncbi:MAG: NAD(P)-dependent oxidoreductase [Spirochaetales bacterium]|nr:NAD(P)-dependent oxidoreductase [Spirochaetales bacterium]